MIQLSLDEKPWIYIHFGIGVLSMVAGISLVLANLGDLGRLDYSLAFVFILAGLAQMTNHFGTRKALLRNYDNRLLVKWIRKFRTKEIEYSQIESIQLRRAEIIINQYDHKALKLNLLVFRTKQIRLIYEFFINLAKDHNLNLAREFS